MKTEGINQRTEKNPATFKIIETTTTRVLFKNERKENLLQVH